MVLRAPDGGGQAAGTAGASWHGQIFVRLNQDGGMVHGMACTILMLLGAAAWAQGAAAFAPQAGPFFAGAPPSRASAQANTRTQIS
jgi:hypothetical protein